MQSPEGKKNLQSTQQYYYLEQKKKEKDKYDILYMWNLKYDTSELIYETDLQTQRIGLWLPTGRTVRDERIWSLGLANINDYAQTG